jgi:hypothetical protein
MSSQFQIVFSGELLDGFELTTVKANAARRLKAAPEQVDRIFSGKRAVLKKGLAEEVAQRYFAELQRIGMSVKLVPETVNVAPLGTEDPIGAIDPLLGAASQPGIRSEPQRVTSRDVPAFDPMKTQITGMADDSPPPERWSQPTIAISQRHLVSTQPTIAASPSADSSDEPTLIVPPRNRGASEPTIVVTRGGSASSTSANSVNVSSSHAPAMVVPPRHSAASEPTIIVPPKPGDPSAPTMLAPPRHSSAAEPTLIVPPRRSAAAEPTVIVPPRHDASSEPTMISPARQAAAVQPVILRSNQKLPPNVKTAETEQPFDPERTLLANLDAVADYQSPASEADLAKAAPQPVPRDPAADTSSGVEVQCPTCGDKQPKRVYCRRCGHALSLPPKPVMGDSTITKKPFTRPPLPAPAPVSSQETVLVEDPVEPLTKSATKKGFLAAPTWFTIILMFLLLLAVAGWLIFA